MKNGQAQPLDERVTMAIDTIVDAMRLRPADRALLVDYVAALPAEANRVEKLPHVSFYPAKTRHGGINWRLSYAAPGHKRRTERLGKMMRPAFKRAQRVSELLQHVHARIITAADAYRELYVNNSPISDHVAAFVNSIRANGVDPKYLQHTQTRLERCLDLGGFTRLGDIKHDALPDLVHGLYAFVEPRQHKKLTTSTINQYLAVLRQFTRWATPQRLPIDPLANTKALRNTEKVARRDVLEEEIAELVACAEAGPTIQNMTGPDRAMVYLTAFGTGLRRGELRATQVEWVRLTGDAPMILLPATVTKNGKPAEQPLPAWLADRLRDWLGGRSAGPLFPTFPAEVHEAFDLDREAARSMWVAAGESDAVRQERDHSDFLKRKTVEGVITYHSLRHSYATTLLNSLDLKTAQSLTRHATAGILADRYAHSRRSKAATAVQSAIPAAPKRQSG